MLKVNVGLSRKVSRDYNSTGFSVNLEGEVLAPLDDPEMIIGKIQELYDLAEESINQQIERYEGESAIASRDEAPVTQHTQTSPPRSNRDQRENGRRTHSTPQRAENNRIPRSTDDGGFVPASNKQISFMTNLAKRHGLTTPQLRKRVAEIVGRDVDLYDLSKSEAGTVLDQLTAGDAAPSSRRR